MFNSGFYPTPPHIIEMMMEGETIQGKTILEPSAGKGNIVDYLTDRGASAVLTCETDKDLRMILAGKSNLIGEDFLQLRSEQISHIDLIVMNPPFGHDDRHINHAYQIAPAGCRIIALCNLQTIKNAYSAARRELNALIESHGRYEELGSAFEQAERKTGVEVALVKLQKEGGSYKAEFEGFFMEEEPEQQEGQEAGIMDYNFIRDLVHRYISAVKLYDEQLNTGVKMENLTKGFYHSQLAFHCTEDNKPKARNEFKKDLQKAAWKFIFNKMNMRKTATRGLKEDINNFVEKQSEVPFTMKNIFRMLEIVIGTTEQRMDKAILEVFENVTKHYHENRFNVEGWKTNSHFLVNMRFIFPYMVEHVWGSSTQMADRYSGNFEIIEDFEKALCYITGDNWDEIKNLKPQVRGKEFGKWNDSHFFRFKGFKKGTMHFEFKSEDIWARFNQRVARLKGYPLFEHNNNKAKNYGQAKEKPTYQTRAAAQPGKVLFSIKLKQEEFAG